MLSHRRNREGREWEKRKREEGHCIEEARKREIVMGKVQMLSQAILIFNLFLDSTVIVARMSHWQWRETKQ